MRKVKAYWRHDLKEIRREGMDLLVKIAFIATLLTLAHIIFVL